MTTLSQDVRFALRLLRRAPGFSAAALLALALGVGATTAVFTLLDRVVLSPLPYPNPDRLLTIWETNASKGFTHEPLSPVNFMDYRGLTQVFEDAAAWWYPQVNLTETGHEPLRVATIETSPNLFSVLGVQPILGPGFPAAPFFSRDLIAVISHRLWRERFGADPGIVGRSITLNGLQFTVTGVMPPDFQYPNGTDVWERVEWDFHNHSRGAHFMEALARLKPGATVARANAGLGALTTRLGREFPATNDGWGARAMPLDREVVGSFRPALFALFGAAGLLLLIACTNVASLLLARASAREREVAIRAAIGASRGRLVRQFLTESVILAALGTGLGLVVAAAGLEALVLVSPVEIPRLSRVSPDPRVLLFGCALAAATAIAFGLVPAFFMARGDLQHPLRDAARGAGDGGRGRVRRLLVVAEVGLAVMLLVGAALLARAFQHLVAQNPGFRPERAMTVDVELPYSYRDFHAIADFYSRLLTSIRSQPGVTMAGATTFLPLSPGWRLKFVVGGRPVPAERDWPQAQTQAVDEDYFKTIGVPLLKGRFFDVRDTAEAPPVVLINETLARREWPGQEPIGQTVSLPVRNIGPMGLMLMPPGSAFQIVGIVADTKNASLVRETEPAIYFSFRQFAFRGLHLVVNGSAGPEPLVEAVRAAVRRMDPDLPLASARPLQRILDDATDRPRALMLLMGVFAALALVLAALGIYGVLSYGVSQRRQELSVRLALGAAPRGVLWLVVRQGLALALAGGALGAAGAFVLGRALASLLYGVSTGDATAFAAAVAVALVTSVAACLLPAWRAARLDPLEGLRRT